MRSRFFGLSLAEVILALGILAMAFFALLSVCTIGLRYNRQSINGLRAVTVADSEMGRTLAGVFHDKPTGTNSTFWGKDWLYPSDPYRKGNVQVGSDTFHYAIYAQTLVGLGDAAEGNRARKLDAYVWWVETDSGKHLCSCSRLLNEGETP